MERTYELIKEYPTSRKLGFEFTADDSHGFIPNPLNWREVIKLDVPIGKKFKHKDSPVIYLLDSINKDNNTVSINWDKDDTLPFLDYPIEKINENFKTGTWILYAEPIKLDVPIGTMFLGSQFKNSVRKIVSIDLDNNVKIIWENSNGIYALPDFYSIEQVNTLFKNGTWKVYIEPIKLDVPIGTEFIYSKNIYTIVSIDLNNRVLINGLGFNYIFTIEYVNTNFKTGFWKLYIEPIKLDVPIGTKFTKLNDLTSYTIDSINSSNKVKVTWFSVNSASNHYTIDYINNVFKNGVWKVCSNKTKLNVPIGTLFTVGPYETINRIDSINSDNEVKIWVNTRFNDTKVYSIELVNKLFGKGIWKAYLKK